jgi:hypothetical protein
MTADGNQTSRVGGWRELLSCLAPSYRLPGSVPCLRDSEQMRVQRLSIADDAQKSCQERRERDCSGLWMRAYFEAGKLQRDIPALVGWLIGYGVVSAVRWIRDGFKLDRRVARNPGDSNDARSGRGLSEGSGDPAMSRILKTLHRSTTLVDGSRTLYRVRGLGAACRRAMDMCASGHRQGRGFVSQRWGRYCNRSQPVVAHCVRWSMSASGALATAATLGTKGTPNRPPDVRNLCFADGIAYLECKTADAEAVHEAAAAEPSAYWDTREVSNFSAPSNKS